MIASMVNPRVAAVGEVAKVGKLDGTKGRLPGRSLYDRCNRPELWIRHDNQHIAIAYGFEGHTHAGTNLWRDCVPYDA